MLLANEILRADLPHLVTSLPGPCAQALIHRDSQVLSPSYTRCYPLVVERGQGAIVEDVDGNRFLDCNAGIAVASTGHCHPEVVAAMQKQAARLIHMSGTDFYYENMIQLAEKLDAISPGDFPHRVYFGNSGTEATEAAMKLARYHTGREKFIAFYGSFHGRTMGALSLTASKVVQRKGFGNLVPGVHHATFPNTYRRPAGMTADDYAVSCVRAIEDQLFRTVLPPEDVAAIIVEPIQGEGGYLIPPRVFHEELRALADRHGILLIHDEVQSGMGRTGKMWASEHFGVVPDIVNSAKGLASGMPLVLVETIASGLRIVSTLRKRSRLGSRFSTMASIIQSTSANRFRSSSKFPTVTRRESDASKNAAGFDFLAPSSPAAAILLRAGPSASGGTMSSSMEGTPALAKCAAMRAPIVPAPRTATL